MLVYSFAETLVSPVVCTLVTNVGLLSPLPQIDPTSSPHNLMEPQVDLTIEHHKFHKVSLITCGILFHRGSSQPAPSLEKNALPAKT